MEQEGEEMTTYFIEVKFTERVVDYLALYQFVEEFSAILGYASPWDGEDVWWSKDSVHNDILNSFVETDDLDGLKQSVKYTIEKWGMPVEFTITKEDD